MSRNCFWGRPCDCSDCKPDLKEKCELCENKAYKVGSTYTKDRKGIPYYDFRTYCYQCYQDKHGRYEQAYYEMLKEIVEEQIKNPPKQKYLEPMTESDIREDLKNSFSAKLADVKFAQRLTPDIVKITISVSFYAGKEQKTVALDEMELPRRGDLEEWFAENCVGVLVQKILSYSGAIRFITLTTSCSLKGCRGHK